MHQYFVCFMRGNEQVADNEQVANKQISSVDRTKR